MPKIDTYNIEGKKTGQIELPKEIFAAKINKPLMAQAIRVYSSNQRRSRAKAKSRGEVSGSSRKIYRQKGTGRARHGDRQAPVFVGGGKAHGPTGEQNYQLRMSKKMKRLALFSALSNKLKEGEICVINGLGEITPKTKGMIKLLENLKLGSGKKILIILSERVENVVRAARNIEGVKLIRAQFLNTYEVLKSTRLVLMKESLEVMEKNFLTKSKSEE